MIAIGGGRGIPGYASNLCVRPRDRNSFGIPAHLLPHHGGDHAWRCRHRIVQVGLATSVTATLPNGLYLAHLLAGYASGATAESRETSFGIGTPELSGTPGKPMVSINGSDITVITYVILAGTSPGVVNLGEYPIGQATTVRTRVATGRYYIRVAAVSAIGRSAPSVETAFDVGLPGQPGPPVVTVNGTSITLVITPRRRERCQRPG